jgi:hypothetical protein
MGMGIVKLSSIPGMTLRRALIAAVVLVSSIWLSSNQKTAAATPANQKVQIPIPLFLDSALDSKKRHAGDPVEAIVASQVELSDGTVIPREAKVTGHVVESKARSKGDGESSLSIVFEKIAMPSGKTMDIKGMVRAVGPNPNPDQNGGGVDYGPSINRAMEHAGPGVNSHSVVPILNAQSEGVQGINDLELGKDGVLRSGGKSVKLGRGVQIMLKAELLGVR